METNYPNSVYFVRPFEVFALEILATFSKLARKGFTTKDTNVCTKVTKLLRKSTTY